MIKPIAIQASQLSSIDLIQDQLIYCTDTKEAYFDITEISRIQLGCTIQLDTEFDKNTISNIQTNKVYIIKETNKLYRHINGDFIEITQRATIIDLLVPMDELIPTTLTKKDINYAPKTLASLVYTNDGNTVEEVLKGMVNDDKKILLYTRTEHVVATVDGQRVFGIPFPIPNYDLAKFPMLIIYKDKILSSADYSISNDQAILNPSLNGLTKDEILTFVFHYNVIINDESLNAESINNVRFFVGEKEPYPKQETDVWFDTKELEVKQLVQGKWKVIVKSSIDDFPFQVFKGTSILQDSSEYVEIPIEGFDPTRDTMMVYENSVYLEEREDYVVSADGRYIKNIGEEVWAGTHEEAILFNFIVFRSTNASNQTQMIKHTTILNNVTSSVSLTNFNFNKYKDTMMVYENSIYLEEGEDYEISYDSTTITRLNESWDGTVDNVYLNFIIIKNSIDRPVIEAVKPAIKQDIDLKDQILKVLGINEEQFVKLKQML